MNIIYSIIIPHYNIPDLLMRCLKSIPIREDIQVIVVDDCSPDFETYKERYPELSRPYLELYQTPKGGSAGRARNVGLEHAKGKWVLFADADDFFVSNMYDIISKYRDENADVIFFKAESVDSDTLQKSHRNQEKNLSIDAYLKNEISPIESVLWYMVVWGNMYSREFISKHRIMFDEIVVCNDVMFVAKVAKNMRTYLFVNEAIYVVTTRINSLHDTKSKDYRRYIVQEQTYLRLSRYCEENGIACTRPFMINRLRYAQKKFGFIGMFYILMMIVKERALFYGLGDYLRRKCKL